MSHRDRNEEIACISVTPLWAMINDKIKQVRPAHRRLTEEQQMFGVKSEDFPRHIVKYVNHMILVAKLCISKYKYGDYYDILRLSTFELSLRNIQHPQ